MNRPFHHSGGLPLFDYAFDHGDAPQPAPQIFRSAELFAGAGGLGMGLARAGFRHEIVVERDADACATLRHNKANGHSLVADWNIVEADVRNADLSAVSHDIDLLAGGPPCQPFSIGGRHAGQFDSRDMWPWSITSTRKLRPKAFVFENVRNLASSFQDYLDYIKLQLSFPELERQQDETIESHVQRLRAYKTGGRRSGLWYDVDHILLNAADHGVAQNRHRVFIIGFRSDQLGTWRAPQPTHSAAALEASKFLSGAYYERHGLARAEPNEQEAKRLRAHNRKPPEGLHLQPHRTLRDAISDLGEPGDIEPPGLTGHTKPPREARAYPGHTGSLLDFPAKALRAGDHGVSGGENMIDYNDIRGYRHFTTREAARLQDFDDAFEFPGVWSAALKQLGNAVPVGLSYRIGQSIAAALQ